MTIVTTYKMSAEQAEPSIDYAFSEKEAIQTHRQIIRLGGSILNVETR